MATVEERLARLERLVAGRSIEALARRIEELDRIAAYDDAGAFVGVAKGIKAGTEIALTQDGDLIVVTGGAGGAAAAPANADYLVGTANPSLSAEIVVGTSPGGELGGTWASPTVDATHSGSAHHTRQHAIEGTSDHSTSGGTNGYVLAQSGATTFAWEPINGGLVIVIDGGGSAITTGVKLYVECLADAVIEGWTLLGDQSGSIVVDVWKDTYANFPPTVADTIAGSEKPTLSSAQKNQDLSLSTWTTTVTRGDVLAINVDSASTVTRVTLCLRMRRT